LTLEEHELHLTYKLLPHYLGSCKSDFSKIIQQ